MVYLLKMVYLYQYLMVMMLWSYQPAAIRRLPFEFTDRKRHPLQGDLPRKNWCRPIPKRHKWHKWNLNWGNGGSWSLVEKLRTKLCWDRVPLSGPLTAVRISTSRRHRGKVLSPSAVQDTVRRAKVIRLQTPPGKNVKNSSPASLTSIYSNLEFG